MESESDVAPGLDSAPARDVEDSDDFYEDDETLEEIDASMKAYYKMASRRTVLPRLRPGVTVCIAAHPARMTTFLGLAIASVLAQTRQPEAILVVNDVDKRGAGWNRQMLLQSVATEWIAWLDSDDEWYPQHLDSLMNYAQETDSVFVYSWFDGGDPLGHFGIPYNPCTPHHTTMTHLVRTDIARRVGFPDSAPGPFSNEDWAFITGVAKICCDEDLKMTHLPERTWYYRQAGQNSSGQPGQGDAR